MKLGITTKLHERYYNGVKELLVKYDETFIPALSYRSSTIQEDFSDSISNNDDNEKAKNIDAYFNSLLTQSFLMAMLNGEILGFMSFFEKTIPYGSQIESNYVSTVIVDSTFRGKGLTKQFYIELAKLGKPITTRTWSGNDAHIHILETLGFETVKRLKNDRGENIDTLYFEWLC